MYFLHVVLYCIKLCQTRLPRCRCLMETPPSIGRLAYPGWKRVETREKNLFLKKETTAVNGGWCGCASPVTAPAIQSRPRQRHLPLLRGTSSYLLRWSSPGKNPGSMVPESATAKTSDGAVKNGYSIALPTAKYVLQFLSIC